MGIRGEGLQERLADEFFLGPCVVLRSLARPCVGWRIALRDIDSSQELTQVIERRENIANRKLSDANCKLKIARLGSETPREATRPTSGAPPAAPVKPSGPLETLIFFGLEPSGRRKGAVRSDGSRLQRDERLGFRL